MIPTRDEMEQAFKMRHGKELQEKFSSAVVAVCGLGGLGSHIAEALARAGIGKLILIDFDNVDVSNLHRQQYKAEQVGKRKTEAIKENLREIAPYLNTEVHNVKITRDNAKELLKDADIICEAFDDAESKAMLTDVVLCSMREKYLIAASGMAGMGSANDIRTRKITERFTSVGDETSEVKEQNSLVASRVMVCAAHQAHAVLRILARK